MTDDAPLPAPRTHAPPPHGQSAQSAGSAQTGPSAEPAQRSSPPSISAPRHFARGAHGERDPWSRASLFVPLAAFAAYLAIGLHTLRASHPMEDAYILFHYVENFVAGRGIVFNAGGPHAEGATDFLWFLALSALARLGFNVAVAACVLNALGAALASFVCVAAVRASGCRGPWAFVLALLSLSVIAIGGALASYFGFSSMAYGALALLLFAVSIAPSARSIAWIPWISLAAGLFRPDGVLLGVVYTLMGFHSARKLGRMRVFAKHALAALVAGALYFAWRYAYFGLLLPLPLYVKENAQAAVDVSSAFRHPRSFMSGLESNVVWIESVFGPARLAACAVLLAFLSRVSWPRLRWFLVLLAPSAALFAGLCFARQTQNFAFRFQAPLMIVVFFAAFALLAETIASLRSISASLRSTNASHRSTVASLRSTIASLRSTLLPALACAAFVFALWPMIATAIVRQRAAWRSSTYMDEFPALLSNVLRPGRTIALTDAGRIPYWTDLTVEDVIGLNTPSAALAPPTLAELEVLSPDIVMFNTSSVFDFPGPAAREKQIVPLTRDMFESALAPACRAAFEGTAAPTGVFATREELAPLRLGRLLATHDQYESFAVAYGSAYAHVWGFKRSLAELPAIRSALQQATSDSERPSYLELVERRRATPSRDTPQRH